MAKPEEEDEEGGEGGEGGGASGGAPGRPASRTASAARLQRGPAAMAGAGEAAAEPLSEEEAVRRAAVLERLEGEDTALSKSVKVRGRGWVYSTKGQQPATMRLWGVLSQR